ncbi:MAG TPA: DUF763 domain-containing protein [Candidatus Deferrimicrobiaceae bacterium]|nr:DUF763 domain-containing protein [Candidatus Deferrimicrobiaceae bacterium]
MGRTGVATLPLHYGKAPRWLFARMAALSREIILAITGEFGPRELLARISDPYWFQALGCVLGFDWHSSGLTTTVTGALKDGLRGLEGELGVFLAGGKGAASRKTPVQIRELSGLSGVDPSPLVYASRMSAKVDNAAVQDGYQLYHHVFAFTGSGEWAVVQQGLNEESRTARRYHWFSDSLTDFVVEPHAAVCCDRVGPALNLTAKESEDARQACAEIARETPDKVSAEIERIRALAMPRRHQVAPADIDPKRLHRTLIGTYERQPEDFETLLGLEGIGPKTIRALSLVSEIVYGKPPSYRDPARFSFAHGGKDGTPFPVDRKGYDRTIDVMKKAIESAKVGNPARHEAIRRLARFYEI